MEPTKEQFYLRRIAELEKEVAELRAQVARLAEQVARLSKNSSNSSKPPSSDIVKPPKAKNPKGPCRQGGQPGHRGVNRSPFRPDQIHHVEELHPTRCPHGHDGELEPTGQTKVQQVAELREDPLEITEYRLHGYRCSVCGEVVWAERPPGVPEGQLFGPRLMALMAYMKGSLHASYTGLAEFCQEVLDIDVSRSHVCNTIARVNDALAKPYEELAEHVPTEPVLNIDESGWKDKGVKYWIWVFSTSLISLFHIDRSRGSKDRFDRIMFRIKDRVLWLAEVRACGECSKSRTLARRFVKHGEAIFRFLFDPAVEPTNNAAERSIRAAVIDRRITHGSRSQMGRQWNARIWTVLGTCRKQGRSAWQFLQNALSAHHFQTPAPSLIPQPAM